ncbi:MAG: hypothetical protein WBA43_02400 [Elainellaceae cyanobacterium]
MGRAWFEIDRPQQHLEQPSTLAACTFRPGSRPKSHDAAGGLAAHGRHNPAIAFRLQGVGPVCFYDDLAVPSGDLYRRSFAQVLAR